MSRRSGKVAVLAAGAMASSFIIDEAVNMNKQMLEDLKSRDGDEFRKQYTQQPVAEPGPPDRLSIEMKSPDYHPSYTRVGVRIDGVERNDIAFYDIKKLEYMTQRKTSHLAKSIVPYWRYPESRQQRRARERWEGKHK